MCIDATGLERTWNDGSVSGDAVVDVVVRPVFVGAAGCMDWLGRLVVACARATAVSRPFGVLLRTFGAAGLGQTYTVRQEAPLVRDGACRMLVGVRHLVRGARR